MIILENLYKAYFEARKNKRNSNEQLRFEMNYEHHLHTLYEQIITRTYQVSPCKAFVINKPVYREVFAPQFIDRVVHHFIVSYITPQVEAILIDDCYSCRKGKGTLYGIKRAQQHLRTVTNNYTKDAYILKLDIAGYFMNMNIKKLHTQVKKLNLVQNTHCSDKEKEILHYLIEKIIFTNPTKKCEIRGDKSLWKFIPKNKSLFHSPANCGLPIGNLTSQIFGNIYLNEFDHWVKEELGIKHYGRYVDDMYFMHNDKEFLKKSVNKIKEKMQEYGMTIHPKKIYFQHYTKGLEFLGRYIKPYRSYISNRTKNNFLQLVRKINTTFTTNNNKQLDTQMLLQYRSRLNSYIGLFQHANSYKLMQKIMRNLTRQFYHYFYFEKTKQSHFFKCKLKKKYQINGTLLQLSCL